ncbi:MAG: hypothetical protein CMK64_03550 [Pseudoalteromonas sp.]|uniref:DUF423 domain-containing protein n=1 Tax=Pseudoalteromonas phenolica TaxID=161398 RepID=UPI000C09F020|nr:hypothetical protein [Pseudoalteromonas sp.]|tara:strand:+ start:1087 stop:1455 length:369 start_codon:yes stop_codon:yes gene_type:complete
MTKLFLLIGSAYCMLSVILGAFAAHGLKKHASEYAVDIFKTAAEYQMFHGLALILVAMLIKQGLKLNASGWLFTFGTILFSGSLYLLALTEWRFLGPITPIGGVCFILGWLLLMIKAAKHKF